MSTIADFPATSSPLAIRGIDFIDSVIAAMLPLVTLCFASLAIVLRSSVVPGIEAASFAIGSGV